MSRHTTGRLAIALGLAFMLAQPLAGRVAARPTLPANATAAPVGKIASPYVDLTLHMDKVLLKGNSPQFVATDPQGDVYVSDPGTQEVYVTDANGTFGTPIGTGTTGTGNGSFNGPTGIVVTGGVVYVADFYNGLIQTFNQSTGAFISQFGGGHLGAPFGLALGSNGTLYVVDTANKDIAEFNTSGIYLGSFGSSGTGPGQFSVPVGIAASPYGPLYVTDATNKNVQEFTLGGSYVTQWGHSSFSEPAGIAVDRAGMVYVSDFLAATIYKFDPSGSLVGDYAAPASTTWVWGTFQNPLGIAVNSVPNQSIAVYVADQTTGEVQRFDQVLNPQVHTYQAQWGSLGSGAGQFDTPWWAAVDPAGNIYVSDSYNNRVEKFDQFGNLLLAFGSAGSGTGQFLAPTGIAISPDGTTVYVVDNGNDRVETFDASGNYTGQFGSGGTGDGQFSNPIGVATDGAFIYVTDDSNNRVEVFDSSGYLYQFGSGGSGNGQFYGPMGIALDIARDELFVSDSGNNRVEVLTVTGVYVTSLTSAAGMPLSGPHDVATDQRGDVYVADQGNNRIVEFDVNLTRTTAFGSYGTGSGQFNQPFGVAVSPTNGQIYVADTDNNRVERFGSPWPKNDTVGIWRPSTKTFYLRNENTTGPADISVYMPYAQSGDLPIVGDWSGDGVDTVGLYRPSKARFLLQLANVQESAPDIVFTLGLAGDTPIAGDWNGQGADGAGIFRPSNGILYLKNTLSTGVADDTLVLGIPGDVGIAGDWNADGQDSPGVYRPSNERFYVTNKVTNGVVTSDHSAVLGISGDVPFTGDWVYQGFSGIGVFRPTNGVTYEKNVIVTGPADNNFVYGVAGDVPVAGQWVAPTVLFSAPAPHVSLGTRGPATQPSTGHGGPVLPAGGHPAQQPATPVATPSRRSGQQ